MSNKLAEVTLPNKSGKILDPTGIKETRPAISITFLGNSYNFKHLIKKSRGNSTNITTFHEFLKKARDYSTIEELISNHKPRKKLKNIDKKSKDKMKNIRDTYNIETNEMFHLHCCRNGGGKFVLHGFRINNRFEIVWIDPEHEIHK